MFDLIFQRHVAREQNDQRHDDVVHSSDSYVQLKQFHFISSLIYNLRMLSMPYNNDNDKTFT